MAAGKRKTRPTTAERALSTQIKAIEDEITPPEFQNSEEDQARHIRGRSLRDIITARTLIARLSAKLETMRAARIAGSWKDPIRRLEALRDLAEADGSWVAAQRLGTEAREMAEEAARIAEASKEGTRKLTPEERIRHATDAAERMGADELEAVVVVWLATVHHELEVDPNGHMHLVRQGLQVVG